MKRRIFNWLTLLSLLLAVGVVTLWVRTNLLGKGEEMVHIGPLFVSWWRWSIRIAYAPSESWKPFYWHWYGFIEGSPGPQNINPDAIYNGEIVGLPHWFLLIVFWMLPHRWIVLYRYKRRQLGICRKCGYDLRASKESCPECGEPVPLPSPSIGMEQNIIPRPFNRTTLLSLILGLVVIGLWFIWRGRADHMESWWYGKRLLNYLIMYSVMPIRWIVLKWLRQKPSTKAGDTHLQPSGR